MGKNRVRHGIPGNRVRRLSYYTDNLWWMDGGSARFTPNSIPGLAAWMDASDVSTVTLDGSNNVSAILDKSGNSRNWSQATVLQRPNYITAAQNGLNAIRVTNGGPLWIGNSSSSAESYFGAGRNICTQFVVWKYTAQAISHRVYDGSDNNRLVRINSHAASTTWNTSAYNPTSYATSTSWRIQTVRYDGPNSKHDSWVGSTKVATQTNFTGFSMATSNNYRWDFGSSIVGADADFGEAIHYNVALSDSDVALLIAYLAAKWGA